MSTARVHIMVIFGVAISGALVGDRGSRKRRVGIVSGTTRLSDGPQLVTHSLVVRILLVYRLGALQMTGTNGGPIFVGVTRVHLSVLLSIDVGP
jgi:hypothetical protein